jgi:peptide/nickel transport system substrate-binding protein
VLDALVPGEEGLMYRKLGLRFFSIAISLVTVLAVFLSACAVQGQPVSQQASSNGKPVQGGTWIDDMPAVPTSLLPLGASTVYANIIDQALYTPILYGDSKGQVHPGLLKEIPTVENGDVSPDFRTFTFKLRPNLQWSDGQPLTAEDLDYTWKLDQNPDFGALFTSGFDHIKSADVSSDKLSITYHLTSAYAPFISNFVDALSGSPLPKHHFQSMKAGDILKSSDNLFPKVVSGPFMVQDSNPGQQFTFVPNPKYYRASEGLPHLAKLVYNVGVSSDTILNSVKAGSITASWNLDIAKLPTYRTISGYQVVNPMAGGYEGLFFNFKNPVLSDNNVRKAIVMGLNRQEIHDSIKPGIGTLLCIDVPPSLPVGYDANAPCPQYDAAAANQLLDQSGWKEGSDGIRVKNGQKLEFPLSTLSSYLWRVNSVTFIQSQLKNIGVQADIQNYPSSTLFSEILPQGNPSTYGISEFGFDFSYDPDDSATLACNQIPSQANGFGGENYSFYCNKQLDVLLDKELSTLDNTVRSDTFKQIHAIQLSVLPYIGLYDSAHPAVAKSTTHNYTPGPMGGEEAINVWDWWCTDGKC